MITRAALDYLPVAVRAAERNPDSNILWFEAVRAQRAVINAGDALAVRGALREAGAAQIQAYVGRIADYATQRPTAHVVAASERLKDRIMALAHKA